MMKAAILALVLIVTACTYIVDPEPVVTITAGIESDVQDSIGGVVTFLAVSHPADTIYYKIVWPSRGWQLELGKGIPTDYEEDFGVRVPFYYNKDFEFHIDFIAWGPKSDTATVTFINVPR